MRRLLVWALVGLVLATPSVHAHRLILEEKVEIGLESAVWSQVTRWTDDQARDLRRHVDQAHGDADGVVDPAEAARYAREHTLTFTSEPGCFDDYIGTRIDGAAPIRVDAEQEILMQATGDVNQSTPVHSVLVRAFGFNRTANETGRAEVHFINFDGLGSWACLQAHGPDGNRTWRADHTWQFSTIDNMGVEPKVRATHSIQPMPGFSLRKDSLTPAQYRGNWDGRGWTDEGQGSSFFALSELRFLIVRGEAVKAAPASGDLGWLGWAGLFLLPVAGALAWRLEVVRLALMRLLVAFAAGAAQRDHPRRELLREHLRRNPGASFSDLRRETEIGNGALLHHLRALEDAGELKAVRDGVRVRFYPRIAGALYVVPATDDQRRLDAAVRAHPGINQSRLADVLGWKRLAVHRRSRHLLRSGRIRVDRQGRTTRYFPGAPATVAAPPLYVTPASWAAPAPPQGFK